MKIAFLLTSLMSASFAFYPDIKDTYAPSDLFLRDLLDVIGSEAGASDEYSDDDPLASYNDARFLARAQKDQSERLMDYDSILERTNPHPSLRDQEHSQHSSLWGYQFMSGGAGEGRR
jgi:hypothetical protein